MTAYVPPGHKGYELRRQFKGVGQIRLATGTRSKKQLEAYSALLTKLYQTGRIDLLRALKRREITLREVLDADRRDALTYEAASVILARPLWPAVRAWVKVSAAAPASRSRYQDSWDRLEAKGVLHADAKIGDLESVNWLAVHRAWGASGADWNRLRAAVSRFLTMTLGNDKYHPFRRKVVAAMPKADEPKRHRPDIDRDLFWTIVANAPDYVQPAYVTMAVTGTGPGEYLSLEPHHLRHHTRSIEIPGTKAKDRDRVVELGPTAWEWVTRGVPSPLKYKWLRIHWKRACAAAGKDFRLYDLRHLYGHMLSDQGLADAKIGTLMGHSSPTTTRRYTTQSETEQGAAAVEDWLFGPEGDPNETRKTGEG